MPQAEIAGTTHTPNGWLLARGLLDELSLFVHPIVVGHGERLFEDGSMQPLRLTSHEAFSTGVLALTYEPAR